MNKILMNMNFLASNLGADLEGDYNIESIITAINNIISWVQRVGIVLIGLTLVVGFVMYGVSSAEKKPRVKDGLTQTIFALVGVILATSILKIICGLF